MGPADDDSVSVPLIDDDSASVPLIDDDDSLLLPVTDSSVNDDDFEDITTTVTDDDPFVTIGAVSPDIPCDIIEFDNSTFDAIENDSDGDSDSYPFVSNESFDMSIST